MTRSRRAAPPASFEKRLTRGALDRKEGELVAFDNSAGEQRKRGASSGPTAKAIAKKPKASKNVAEPVPEERAAAEEQQADDEGYVPKKLPKSTKRKRGKAAVQLSAKNAKTSHDVDNEDAGNDADEETDPAIKSSKREQPDRGKKVSYARRAKKAVTEQVEGDIYEIEASPPVTPNKSSHKHSGSKGTSTRLTPPKTPPTKLTGSKIGQDTALTAISNSPKSHEAQFAEQEPMVQEEPESRGANADNSSPTANEESEVVTAQTSEVLEQPQRCEVHGDASSPSASGQTVATSAQDPATDLPAQPKMNIWHIDGVDLATGKAREARLDAKRKAALARQVAESATVTQYPAPDTFKGAKKRERDGTDTQKSPLDGEKENDDDYWTPSKKQKKQVWIWL